MSEIVLTRHGKVRGSEQAGVFVFKGIPFAQPPVGALRFQPPLPPVPWSGVYDATRFGSAGWQVDAKEILKFAAAPAHEQSEDCLTLNVWSPGADGIGRPVLVWIYGGSFVMGSGRLPVYDGSSLAATGDMVVVTLNYRLGPFGFLYLGDMGESSYAASANVGLLDQIAALEWVKENIEAFGGDPGRVTVAGESAGAISISALLTMPKARGLFHQAIMQSGVGLLPPLTTVQRAEVRDRYLQRLGISTNPMSQLQSCPASELLRHSRDLTWLPALDGISIHEPFWPAVAAGSSANIPVLVGYNHHEFRYFMNPEWKVLAPEVMRARFSETWAGPVTEPQLAAYGENAGGRDLDLYGRLAKLATDKLFTAPAHWFGQMQASRNALWVYRFDWESRAHEDLGACHALDIPFAFNTLDAPGVRGFTGTSPDQASVVAQMQSAWIAFVRNGNPNTASLPYWPPYSLDRRETLLLNATSSVADDPDNNERRFWEPFFRALSGL